MFARHGSVPRLQFPTVLFSASEGEPITCNAFMLLRQH